jgi:hypothetical protein
MRSHKARLHTGRCRHSLCLKKSQRCVCVCTASLLLTTQAEKKKVNKEGEAPKRQRQEKVRLCGSLHRCIFLTTAPQPRTYPALFDQKPGLFVLSLRLLNLRLRLAGYKDPYRLSPLQTRWVALSSFSLTRSSKTVGAFVEIDIAAMPGLFEYLGKQRPELKDSLDAALAVAGVGKGIRKTSGSSISAANHVMEELYTNDVTKEQKEQYKRPHAQVHTVKPVRSLHTDPRRQAPRSSTRQSWVSSRCCFSLSLVATSTMCLACHRQRRLAVTFEPTARSSLSRFALLQPGASMASMCASFLSCPTPPLARRSG